jgi:hypothetical protein
MATLDCNGSYMRRLSTDKGRYRSPTRELSRSCCLYLLDEEALASMLPSVPCRVGLTFVGAFSFACSEGRRAEGGSSLYLETTDGQGGLASSMDAVC